MSGIIHPLKMLLNSIITSLSQIIQLNTMNYHWQSMKLCLKTKMRILALSVIDDCSLNILQLVFNGNDNNKIVSNNRLFSFLTFFAGWGEKWLYPNNTTTTNNNISINTWNMCVYGWKICTTVQFISNYIESCKVVTAIWLSSCWLLWW